MAAIGPTIPTQLVQTFVDVALNEGKSLGELAELVGSNASTVSRHLLDLGERNRRMEPGYGLVDRRVDPMELRKNSYFLTPKGKALARSEEHTSELQSLMRISYAVFCLKKTKNNLNITNNNNTISKKQ